MSIKRKAAFALPFFLSAILSPTAAAAREERLPPFSSWQLVKHEKTCVLRRAFGSAAEPLLVQLERFKPGDSFQLLLAGPYLRRWRMPDSLTVLYEPNQGVHKVTAFMAGTLSDGMPTVILPGSSLTGAPSIEHPLPDVTPEIEAAVSSIVLVHAGQKIMLETGSLAEPFAEFRKCTDQLAAIQGLPAAQQGIVSQYPTPLNNPANWVTSNDYPIDGLRRGTQAIVNFRITVGIDGLPTNCEVQSSYSNKQFDDLTCELLKRRARFSPALDANGKPISSFFHETLRWLIP